MKIYYFSKDIVRGNGCFGFGNGKIEEYTSKEELIKKFEETLDNGGYSPLTEEELASIICGDMPNYDFYTVQFMVDGFGHDTFTDAAFKTYEECAAWIANEYKNETPKIVGQFWGGGYVEYFG